MVMQRFRPASLVPAGLVVDGIAIEGDRVVVRARSAVGACPCPDCGAFSPRIQGRYFRRAKDLPLSGRRVEFNVLVQRFRYDAVLCGRQIFAERFGDCILAPRARRTDRLDHIVQHLGLALGGRPGASFAARMMLPVSNDTLLRVVRQRARVPSEPLRVIGIDDFAWGYNHRCGTIVCGLERRRPVVLLQGRAMSFHPWKAELPRSIARRHYVRPSRTPLVTAQPAPSALCYNLADENAAAVRLLLTTGAP